MLEKPSQSVDAPRQIKNMTQTQAIELDGDLSFLNLKEVAGILRVAPISVYRLIAKRAIPVYRACHKILFKRNDVLAYLEKHRKDQKSYGRSQD